ncbi:MAG: hypothetical protein WEA58_04005 [Balneolaceae bacterium]
MSFKQSVAVPHNVEIERFYSKAVIDNGDSTVSLFPSNPSSNKVDTNYSQNPFPESKYHVILGISLDPLMKVIRQTADIDPAYIINNLNDGTLVLSSNQGRTADIVNPIKDYLNFNNISIATGPTGADTYQTVVTLGSTGVRKPDNLFYLGQQESFTLELLFNSGVWPSTANWAAAEQGRFGITAEMYVAKMTEAELDQYREMLK